MRLATIRGWRVMDDNRSYFMRRAAQERSAADRATDEAARLAHLELARRYRNLVGAPQQTQANETAA